MKHGNCGGEHLNMAQARACYESTKERVVKVDEAKPVANKARITMRPTGRKASEGGKTFVSEVQEGEVAGLDTEDGPGAVGQTA